MIKLYCVDCLLAVKGEVLRAAELERGEHCGVLFGDGWSAAVIITVGVRIGKSGIAECEFLRVSGAEAYAFDGYYVLLKNAIKPLTLPKVSAQHVIGGYTLTFWSGGARYITAELGEYYALIEAESEDYDFEMFGKCLLITGGKHVALIDERCRVIFNSRGEFERSGNGIKITCEYAGAVNRVIEESYDLSGALTSRKVTRTDEGCHESLTACAFIECFIYGDIEMLIGMLDDSLRDSLDDVIGFIGEPKRIALTSMPIDARHVIAEYADGYRVYELEIENGKICDVEILDEAR